MDSSSSDTLDEEEDLQSLQKRLKQRKNERRQKILRKKSAVKLQPQQICSATPDEQKNTDHKAQLNLAGNTILQTDPFPTYKKLPGAIDHGKEYEQMMCAFYALKLIRSDEIVNFKMTTNSKNCGVFDDVELQVTFRNTKSVKFLIQLKHKEAAKPISTHHLYTGKQKGDFDVEKYFNSMSSEIDATEDVVCILYTNSPTYIEESAQLSATINITKCAFLECEELLLNSKHIDRRCIFEVESTELNKKFYFFTEQNNIFDTKIQVEEMLRDLVECNIYGSFIHFMSEWWSLNFVLSRDDVIAKLVELTLSPYLKDLSDMKRNAKSENLKQAIMRFQVTIVTTDEDIVNNIWTTVETEDKDYDKARRKFGLKTTEQGKILWYLNKVPLVTKVDASNKPIVLNIVNLMNQATDAKKVVLVGDVALDDFPEMNVFESLFDVIKNFADEPFCDNILDTFEVSLQGRDPICLTQLVEIDPKIAKQFRVDKLLTMSQSELEIGGKKEETPHLHIPRSVSSVFVKLEEILTFYDSRRSQTMVIINCDEKFKDRLAQRNDVTEISDYLTGKYTGSENVVLLSPRKRCTHSQFTKVCEVSGKSNVYLFQVFDDDDCVLLLKKGSEFYSEDTDKSKLVAEMDILNRFDNPLNVLCAPPGMGKSTLMKILYQNCPRDSWAIYTDLITWNSFLLPEPDFELIREYLLHDDDKDFKTILWKNKKMYLFLDGLDEVDNSYLNHVLSFVTKASSRVNVWISSRENLRGTISQTLNVVPIEIQELNHHQQRQYIHEKLQNKYQIDEIETIVTSIFASTDLNNSQQLLGIPLQLHIITEMFLTSDQAYNNIKQKNIFVLTQMYQLFFEGKLESTICKVVSGNQKHQLGMVKIFLKQYEVPALKACLDAVDFDGLGVSSDETEDFLDEIKHNGDKYGIIKQIGESGEAVFDHQTYAEYFACVWFRHNKSKIGWFGRRMFSPRYDNLRVMLDVMLAANNPLHLSIIYKNEDQFMEHLDEIDDEDEGGRRALHLVCTYGTKYSSQSTFSVVPRLHQEPSWYVTMVGALIRDNTNVNDKDNLFGFDCVNYCLEATNLYPIEIILRNKLLTFQDLEERVFEVYSRHVVSHYAAQMGFRHLLSELIDNTPLLREETTLNQFLEAAVKGTRDVTLAPREDNIAIVKTLLSNGLTINDDESVDDLDNILYIACTEGKYDMLDVLVENGARLGGGDTVWHLLSKLDIKDDPRILNLLRSVRTVDVNLKNDESLTALHVSCMHRSFEMTKILLEKNVDVNSVDDYNNNALYYVVRDYGGERPKNTKSKFKDFFPQTTVVDNNATKTTKVDKDIIKLLIDNGIYVNVRNTYGRTPLHFCCENADFKTTEALLEHRALVNTLDKDDNSALHYASTSSTKNTEVLKLLLDKGSNVNTPNSTGLTPLHYACLGGNVDNVKLLLENNAMINFVDEDRNNPLHVALFWNNRNVAKFLIDNGIDINARNGNLKTALHFACENGDYEVTEKLLENNASINVLDKNDKNGLLYASESWESNRDLIKLLLRKGIDIDVPNKNGAPALHLACENGDLEVAEILLERSASVNVLDNDKNTLLHYASAAEGDNEELASLLVKEGVDVNAGNKNGSTALHFACRNGNFKVAKMLIGNKGLVNVLDEEDSNALFYASESWRSNRDIIKLLISEGIDVDVRNKGGVTIGELARINDDVEVLGMLKR
ncbi:hypothetical protein Zmor_009973 [Zophobas morio]|uniref:NACHT domain-containing protein n=1 Tax=Zophobas morio TaxID=2755281 RepID=A0AA38MIH2_9CUCU|nr:hypothetical protein Zmor_009973 [Zophobas morio]